MYCPWQDGLTELNLSKNFGLFITINPKVTHKIPNDSGHTLPAFLKSDFRPIACVQPDRDMICAISLYTDGFLQANVSIFIWYNLGFRIEIKISRIDFYMKHSYKK